MLAIVQVEPLGADGGGDHRPSEAKGFEDLDARPAANAERHEQQVAGRIDCLDLGRILDQRDPVTLAQGDQCRRRLPPRHHQLELAGVQEGQQICSTR
jgi:hypothetical protein